MEKEKISCYNMLFYIFWSDFFRCCIFFYEIYWGKNWKYRGFLLWEKKSFENIEYLSRMVIEIDMLSVGILVILKINGRG